MSDEPPEAPQGPEVQEPEGPKAPTLTEIIMNLNGRLEQLERVQADRDAKLNEFMGKLQKAAEAGPPPQAQLPAPKTGGTAGELLQLVGQAIGGDTEGGGGDAAFAQVGKAMFDTWARASMRMFAKQLGVAEHVTIEG